MLRYIFQRLLAAVPVLLLMSFLVFSLTYLIPGDPVRVVLGTADVPDEVYQATLERLGLNQPFVERYFRWLGDVVQGDLGTTYISQQSIAEMLGRALPVTLQLMMASMILALAIAIPSALVSALWRGSLIDMIVTPISFVGLSIPRFWLALWLIYFFAVRLRLLPATGYTSPTEDLGQNIRGMILPSLTLGILLSTGLTRFLRASLLDAAIQDHVRTARMKGLPERLVIRNHILRNASLPFMTIVGLETAFLLGGTVLIEDVFALPGMGRLALQSILLREYLTVQAIVLILGTFFVVINLAIDLLYAMLDPRVRLDSREAG